MKFTPSSKYINEILVIIIEHMMNVALTYCQRQGSVCRLTLSKLTRDVREDVFQWAQWMLSLSKPSR